MRRRILYILFGTALTLAGCGLMKGKSDHHNQGLLLLLLAASQSSSSSCQNQSGLVIFIPPGLRQSGII